MWVRQKQSGFTIVELLIVIVVIGILAAITIVAFNGIRSRAVTAAINADLASTSKAIKLYQADNSDNYPTSLAQLNGGSGVRGSNGNVYGYVADNTASPKTFSLTVMNDTSTPRSVNQNGVYSDGAAPLTVGGQDYCPESSYVALNGYYCDGSVGAVGLLNTGAIKQPATASGVPAGAPTYFVGVQSSRDNLIGATFAVVPGEVYCVSGYAATASSVVTHTIGLMLTGTATSWATVNNLAPSSTWQKLSGCITIPSTATSARFWAQNNGDGATTATVAWYHSALMLKKQ